MIRAFLASVRIGMRNALAWRTDLVLQLAAAGMVAALNGSLWRAATSGRAELAGVPGTELLSYGVVVWVGVSAVATRVHEELGERFRDGGIAIELLRPGGVQLLSYGRDLGRAAVALALRALPLLGFGVLLFPISLPQHPLTWILWALSLLLAHAVNFGLAFLVGLAAAKLHDITGLGSLKTTAVALLSGAMIPPELFGPTGSALVHALPFSSLAWAPASVFLERPGAASVLVGQAAWALGLAALGAWGWRAARVSLTVQGG